MLTPKPAWLPDLCSINRLVAVLGVAQLVVLVIALAPVGGDRWRVPDFLSVSAYAAWVALASAVLLCKLRARIHGLGPWLGRAVAVAAPMAVAGLCAWSLQFLGFGDPQAEAAGTGGGFIASSMVLTGLIGGVALRYFYVRDQWQAQVQARAKASVDALQARIRPHFLFNSMNSIASLVRTDPVSAERALEDLADLFRAALGAGDGDATLQQEIELARRYLAIEKLRLRDRLRVSWKLPEPLPAIRLPKLVLQPLLENAVVHGIAPLPEGGEIEVSIRVARDRLELRITNPCRHAGMNDAGSSAGNGHAQASIAQRLAFHFGPGAKMTARLVDGHYFCEISLPMP
ncbi:MAG: sensor histidine kinase [Arenimonas sp.]|uniref:sensor histidine kinase n=1 Tax=Arenimonas sp. TaxID=1872635 RepID=UPI0025BA7FDD|nr:sensor histidine kinase [Arenimonas sp.]MBW8366814.1 sensor histidine kinase [Arenimonas sp.]